MKKGMYFIVLVCLFFAMPFALAETDKAYTDKQLAAWGGDIWRRIGEIEKNHNDLIARVDKHNSNVANQIENMTNTISNLCARCVVLEKQVKEIESNVNKADCKASWALGIFLFLVAAVVAVLLFAFCPHRSPRTIPTSTPCSTSSQSRCPRCGWEHDPDDTVCKNPNCRTQF